MIFWRTCLICLLNSIHQNSNFALSWIHRRRRRGNNSTEIKKTRFVSYVLFALHAVYRYCCNTAHRHIAITRHVIISKPWNISTTTKVKAEKVIIVWISLESGKVICISCHLIILATYDNILLNQSQSRDITMFTILTMWMLLSSDWLTRSYNPLRWSRLKANVAKKVLVDHLQTLPIIIEDKTFFDLH